METVVNKVIPFLDALIDSRKNTLTATTHHKLTCSAGLLLSFNSFTSRFYKISLIKCLTDRAFDCQNYKVGFGQRE